MCVVDMSGEGGGVRVVNMSGEGGRVVAVDMFEGLIWFGSSSTI